jgi:hypothetical protein
MAQPHAAPHLCLLPPASLAQTAGYPPRVSFYLTLDLSLAPAAARQDIVINTPRCDDVVGTLCEARPPPIANLVKGLETLGYRWAYRVVDLPGFGLPQRRRRVFVVASLHGDPRDVILSQNGRCHGGQCSARKGAPPPSRNLIAFHPHVFKIFSSSFFPLSSLPFFHFIQPLHALSSLPFFHLI